LSDIPANWISSYYEGEQSSKGPLSGKLTLAQWKTCRIERDEFAFRVVAGVRDF
jgi:hypothetical protein